MNQPNYKDTLNLPKTEFSMKANLSVLEPRILSLWQKEDIYKKIRDSRKGKDKFVLHDGPPYANGLIHIGHALNKILKDIIIKYMVLKGYDCPYIIGWDCHGLPVEHQLFKELNKTKHDVDIVDFRKRAKDFALKFVELQKEDFKRLGIFSDWDRPYLTLNKEYEYKTIKLLEYLTKQGYVYRGRRPVNWCSSCETALAEAEVEYYDKESNSIYVLFPVKNGKNAFVGNGRDRSLQEKNVYFLVWTTTPWTLVSNVAVAVHPEFSYSLVGFEGKSAIVADALLPTLEKKLNTTLKVIKSFRGKDLEGIELNHPFLERKPSVVLAEFISKEEGSGCVHIAPGHGAEDFSLTRKYNLEFVMPVNDKGLFEEPADFKGKNIEAANKLVLEKLSANNSLVKHEKITHSYPHCWRCKNPIIFRATFQWFVNVDLNDLRNKTVKEVDNVQWVPSGGKERMKVMLITRPDWCLSRQRLWGIPIPAVKCVKCNEVILNDGVVSKTAEIFKEKGSDSWFSLNVTDFLPQGFSCPKCNGNEFVKEFDILDVWFESGASFFAVLKDNPELKFPADMYLEGSDQHRGWFQVSLIPSVALEGRAPFKTILTHGFVVDGDGRKMSKSLGNVIAPQQTIKQYGAEILRLWAAYSDYAEDVKISDNIVKQLVDIYRKVRNTIKFILGNLSDYDPDSNSIKYEELLEVDKFMLAKTMQTAKAIMDHYENYGFYKVCQEIFNFCNLSLSSFYLDILKDRLYTFSPNSRERRSAQFVIHNILDVLLKLTAPIFSFTAEEAYLSWQNYKGKKESIFISTLDETYHCEWVDEKIIKEWEKILGFRDNVLKEIELKRQEGSIGSSLEAEIFLKFNKEDFDFYKNRKDILREIFIVSEVNIEEGFPEIKVEKTRGEKCLRCWNYRSDVGCDKNLPGTCSRCVKALKGGN
ncbi:MAG: isoleucine--tRNA ligase [Candidatus Omnitrophota bacterium]|jgi:isoleucyl-tRNA synthetase